MADQSISRKTRHTTGPTTKSGGLKFSNRWRGVNDLLLSIFPNQPKPFRNQRYIKSLISWFGVGFGFSNFRCVNCVLREISKRIHPSECSNTYALSRGQFRQSLVETSVFKAPTLQPQNYLRIGC